MTRGKYAKRAADKRAELEVTTDLATYQHRVAKLTAENRELREQMEQQRRTASAVERRLRAERDEGLGPQVAALSHALGAITDERDKARRAVKHMRKSLNRTGQRAIEHYMVEHGMAYAEAVEAVTSILMDVEIVNSQTGIHGSISETDQEGAELIQMARGLRAQMT